MTEHTKTGSAWEPSDAMIGAIGHAIFGSGWLNISNKKRNEICSDIRAAIIATIASDPLLSAAAEMREALEGLISSVGKRNPHMDEPGWGEVLAAILIAKTVIEKSRGEN